MLGFVFVLGIEEVKYLEMIVWLSGNWKVKFEMRRFLEFLWFDVYWFFLEFVNDFLIRFDMILFDYWVDVIRDISFEYDILLVMYWL